MLEIMSKNIKGISDIIHQIDYFYTNSLKFINKYFIEIIIKSNDIISIENISSYKIHKVLYNFELKDKILNDIDPKISEYEFLIYYELKKIDFIIFKSFYIIHLL